MQKAIVTLTAPSLTGKTWYMRRLEQVGPFLEMVSHTTRARRNGEIDGRDYYFVTPEEFDQQKFIELVEFNGQRYGLAERTVLRAVNSGQMPVAVVEPNGAQQIRAWCEAAGYRHFPIYLHESMEVRMQRWLQRYDANPENQAAQIARLRAMITEESKWKDAMRYTLHIGPGGYNYLTATSLMAQWLDVPLHEYGVVTRLLSAA